MNRQLPLLVLVALGCPFTGCVPEGGDGGAPEVIPLAEDAEVDAAPMSDLISQYCERSSLAKCEWVFGCLNGSPQITTVFGFDGPMVSNCAAAEEETCLADLRDRDARGTVNPLVVEAIDSCVGWLTNNAPCVGGDPADWIGQWRMAYDGYCGSVARGNVQSGEACQTRTDCFSKADICLGGSCGIAKARDLLQSCENLGAIVGALVPDPACDTGFCVNTGEGGMCSLDCCAGGDLVCLSLTVAGSPPNSFCSISCTDDRQCGDFACQTVNEDDDGAETYCFGKAR
jgi:hypothetical protein